MNTQSLILLGLLAVLIIVAVARPRQSRPRAKPKPRRPQEGMLAFGLRHPEFVSQLVRNNIIQNVILYRFIDGYLEEGGFRKPENKTEEKNLMGAARRAIKELLTRPPIGIAVEAETFEQALKAWRQAKKEQTE